MAFAQIRPGMVFLRSGFRAYKHQHIPPLLLVFIYESLSLKQQQTRTLHPEGLAIHATAAIVNAQEEVNSGMIYSAYLNALALMALEPRAAISREHRPIGIIDLTVIVGERASALAGWSGDPLDLGAVTTSPGAVNDFIDLRADRRGCGHRRHRWIPMMKPLRAEGLTYCSAREPEDPSLAPQTWGRARVWTSASSSP